MPRQIANGFTLVELMTVVIIIGVLGAVGSVAYKQYVLRSKTAEAYILLDSIKKAQVTYFNENRHFINISDGQTGRITSGGGKFASDASYSPLWGFLGTPIRPSTDSYFSYATYAGFYADDGTEMSPDIANYPGEDIEWVYEPLASDVISHMTGTRLFTKTQGGDCSATLSGMNAASFGITEAPGEHYFIVFAGADFTIDNSRLCSVVFQTGRVLNGEHITSPFVSLRMGQ